MTNPFFKNFGPINIKDIYRILGFKNINKINKIKIFDVTDLNIVWEASRGGQLFPHLYDVLPLSAVVRVWDLQLDENHKHLFPEVD